MCTVADKIENIAFTPEKNDYSKEYFHVKYSG